MIDSAKKCNREDPEFTVLAYLFYKLNAVLHDNCNQTNAKTFATALKIFEPGPVIASDHHFRDRVGRKNGSHGRDDNESDLVDIGSPKGSSTSGSSGKKSHDRSGKKSSGRGGGDVF